LTPAWLIDAWSGLSGALRGSWDATVGVVTAAIGRISGLLADLTPQSLVELWQGLPALFDGLLAELTPQRLVEAWQDLAAFFAGVWNAVEAVFNSAVNAIKTLAEGLTPQSLIAAWWQLAGFWRGLWDGVVGVLERAKNIIGAAIDWIIGKLQPLTGAISAVTGALGTVGGAIGGAASRLGGALGLTRRPEAEGGGAPSGMAAAGPAMMATTGPQLAAAQQQTSKSEVSVNFSNVPEGTRIRETRSTGNTEVNLRSEYAGPRGALAGAY
jgi:hypothetical protein